MREVQESGDAAELDELVQLDDKKREITWFPEIIEMLGKNILLIYHILIGKEWFRVKRLTHKTYTCKDEDGNLQYVESESAGCQTPSVKCFPRRKD